MMIKKEECVKHLLYNSNFNEQLIIPLKKHDTRQQQEHRILIGMSVWEKGKKYCKNHGSLTTFQKLSHQNPNIGASDVEI